MNRRHFLTGLGAGALAAGVSAVAGPLPRAAASTDHHAGESASGMMSGSVKLGTATVRPGEVLEFDPEVSTSVEVTGDLFVDGTLRMKPASESVQHVIRFTNGGELHVADGVLDLAGTPKAAWNRTGTDSTWKASDTLVVTPVAAGDYSVRSFRMGAEVPSFESRYGSHSAEVLNLTRNVRIEGTASTPMKRVMIMSPKPQTIRYAAVRYAGIATEIGFYPIHMHFMGDGARGSLLEGVVVRDGFHHAFAIHASHGVTLSDCIAYSIVGDAYWWDLPPENGDSLNNTDDGVWERCVAAEVRAGASTLPNALSGFLLGAGSGNTVRDCVATAVGEAPSSSGFHWPSQANQQPNVWVFEDNISHNNRRNGIFIWQNTVSQGHFVDRYVGYRNRLTGANHGAYTNSGYHYRDSLLLENGDSGANQHAHVATAEKRLVDSRLSFERVTFGSPVALRLVKHTLHCTKPTLYLDCTFDGPIDVDDAAKKRGLYDFVRCGLEPSDFTITTFHPDSVIRVQREDNTAFQITPAGVSEIDEFWDGWSSSGEPIPERPRSEPRFGPR